MTTLTLADKFITTPIRGIIKNHVVDLVVGRARNAHKYVLSESAAKLVATLIRNEPELIALAASTVKAPHDLMWVEWGNRPFWEVINGTAGDIQMDSTVGYLVDQGRAYCISSNDQLQGGCLWPFCYDLHRPWSDEDRNAFSNVTQTAINLMLWGRTITKLEPNQLEKLSAHHAPAILPIMLPNANSFLKHVVRQGSGDLRNIVAILSVLNGDLMKTMTSSNRLRGRTFSGGKSIRLHDYVSVIHLHRTAHIDHTPGTGTPRGPVETRRGHWVSNDVARSYAEIAGCRHVWTSTIYGDKRLNNPRFICTECGGKRWWRSEITSEKSATRRVVP